MCHSPARSHCLTKTSRWAPSLCSPSAMLELAGTCSAYRGHSLIAWLWWPGGLLFLGPTGLWQSETVLGRLPSSGHCTDSKLKHTPSLCEKGLFTCPGASAWGTCFKFVTNLKGRVVLSGNVGQGMPPPHSPSALLRLTSTSQKGAYILIRSPNFSNCHPRDTSRSPGLEANRVYNCGPIGLYIFAYFESCCMRIWLPISLKLGAEWDAFLWNTDRYIQNIASKSNRIHILTSAFFRIGHTLGHKTRLNKFKKTEIT